MDTIDGMKTFVAVARQQSFTAGAKSLGMSTKLASKYIRQLEEKLSAQLFHRTTRSVTLTDTGKAYFDRCIPLLDQFDELEGMVQESQAELAGHIKMTAPTGFGSSKLLEVLRPFQQAHPNVFIDLHLADHYIDVVRDGFDLAIRFGELKDSSLIARKLTDMRLVVFASPAYITAHGKPTHPHDLKTHNCLLQQVRSHARGWPFLVNGELTVIRVKGGFQANSPLAVAQVAANSLGVGMSPYYTVEPFLKEGSLQLLLEEYEARTLVLSAVYPPNQHLTARVRALIDFLAEHLK
ncbi:MAG: LysR family transcriptional regulator [Arenicella sp.]